MMAARTYLISVVFLICLIVPGINHIFGLMEFEQLDENRAFAENPKLDFNHLDAFPKAYEEFYRDHFTFRSPLMRLFHYYKFYVAKKTAHPYKTLFGKDGWYFIAGKATEVHQGVVDFTSGELDRFIAEWHVRDSICHANGVKKLYWAIAPSKHSVYPEFVPSAYLPQREGRRAEIVTDHVNSDFPELVIDPLPQLLRAKENEQVFRRYDNHWNDLGAFIAAQVIIEKIKLDFAKVRSLERAEFEWLDTLSKKDYHRNVLGIDELSETTKFGRFKGEEAQLLEEELFNSPENFYGRPNYELNYKTSDTSLPYVLVIRDSFSDNMLRFLREKFGRSTFIFDTWKYGRNENIISTLKPDIVLYITSETTIDAIIEDGALPDP